MFRTSFRFTYIILLIAAVSASSYFLYTWGGVFYRSFHILMHATSDAPGWISGPEYKINISNIKFSNVEERYEINTGSSVYIYRPEGIKETPFIILVPGFTDRGAADQRIVRISRAFAESGVGVAVPDSDTMRGRIFSVDDINLIVSTFNYLEKQRYVKKKRIALCGFSVGGSYSLIASSRLGNRPLFTVTFGGYYDLRDLAAAVLSGHAYNEGNERIWIPGDIPRNVVQRILGDPSLDDKIGSMDFSKARNLINKMSVDKLDKIRRLSPSSSALTIRTPVYVLHSIQDDSIPVEESDRLVRGLSGETKVYFIKFAGLSHVTPKDILSIDYFKLSRALLKMMKMLFPN